jgi:hypothetical protein
MDDRGWYSYVEPVMQWWISHTPLWMQPKWVWDLYYFALDRFL